MPHIHMFYVDRLQCLDEIHTSFIAHDISLSSRNMIWDTDFLLFQEKTKITLVMTDLMIWMDLDYNMSQPSSCLSS